ncbi:MAG: hypothetical protein KatS3mg031_3074 [Chitinophagales bacterium]|nr:MAG: hypothetical protein KatS3mg031_3074 [Chitinophagales bacterium]
MVKNLIADTNVFLEEAWNKGEILRFVTDPVKFKQMMKVDQKARESTFAKEINWIESKLGKNIEDVIDSKKGTIDLSKFKK